MMIAYPLGRPGAGSGCSCATVRGVWAAWGARVDLMLVAAEPSEWGGTRKQGGGGEWGEGQVLKGAKDYVTGGVRQML